MTTTETALTVERRGSTVTLTLNRPEKMNAFSAGLVEALLAAAGSAYRDGTRLLVLRGNGKNFSAGFDMGGYEAQSEGDLVLRFIRIEQLLQAVRHAPFDTLVLAHGRNFGAGVDLICACDLRLGTADAAVSLRETRVAIVADMGSLNRLPFIIGDGYTRLMAFTGRDLSGT